MDRHPVNQSRRWFTAMADADVNIGIAREEYDMIIGLKITRNEGETWFECAMRYAKVYGLEEEVRRDYDEAIERGLPEDEAAFEACYEWDVCEAFERERK